MREPEILALAHPWGDQIKFDEKALVTNRENLSVFSIYEQFFKFLGLI